jgi:NTP pyrophosphatase (non-canonical NTP hydrolase)
MIFSIQAVKRIIKLVFRDISESNNWDSKAEDWIQFELKEHYNMNRDYFELEVCVQEWAKEKGIFDKATPLKQALKTQEELTELINAIVDDNKLEIEDAIGDIMVTMIIQAEMQGVTIEECLNSAYDIISKRTGKMINGQFVKDE